MLTYSVFKQCGCGNIFAADAFFCRKCGTARPKETWWSGSGGGGGFSGGAGGELAGGGGGSFLKNSKSKDDRVRITTSSHAVQVYPFFLTELQREEQRPGNGRVAFHLYKYEEGTE